MAVTYFRNYGIHRVEPLDHDDTEDYIVSFPTWKQTERALRDNFPPHGNVITPENATTPDGPLTWTENPDLIHEHITDAIKLTEGSEAMLYLGTPLRVRRRGEERWLGSVLTIQNGKVVSTVFKQEPLEAETKVLGVQKPHFDTRRVLGGNAVLICNELFRHTKNPDDYVLKNQEVRQIFSPSLWPIPAKLPEDWDPDKVNVGNDEYYRKLLEAKVASGVFSVMHTVRRVIVSDLGRTGFPYPFTEDIAPFNAVFDRVD